MNTLINSINNSFKDKYLTENKKSIVESNNNYRRKIVVDVNRYPLNELESVFDLKIINSEQMPHYEIVVEGDEADVIAALKSLKGYNALIKY